MASTDGRHNKILEALTSWAQLQPDKTLWSFLDDKGKVIDQISYQDTVVQAMALANYLRSQGIRKGDRALLVFFPSLQFTISLIGCFIAGVIAVPVFPPDPRRLKKDLHHFASIQQSSSATIALTHAAYNYAKKMADIKNVFSSERWPDITWIVIDSILSTARASYTGVYDPNTFAMPESNDVAFLQYTSGSTSEPKGVMITHSNLAHNLFLITTELEADSTTIVVSWLPQYHDMGLIGSYLGILYCGGTGFYMSPLSFLKNPVVWISSMSNFRATHVQAPNFAYALTSRKFNALPPSSRPKLDLTCVRHMINAAEPVDVLALESFYAAFVPFGLGRNVVYPTYGLAEHTVFVCSGGKQRLYVDKRELETTGRVVEMERNSRNSQCIVGCGYPFRGEAVELLIVSVNSDTVTVLGEDYIGEIWINSPSKAKGYWNLEDQSVSDFHARLPASAESSRDHDGYLRTGDLGFLHAGELFITGRLKDLIIVRGSNHYPQDIERTAEKSHDNLRPGCSAAFSVPADLIPGYAVGSNSATQDTECVVLVMEVKEPVSQEEYRAIVDVVKRAVSADHGVGLSCVVLLPKGRINKTTSGKIARAWNRRAFVDGSLRDSSVFWAQFDADVARESATDVVIPEGKEEQVGDMSDVIVTQPQPQGPSIDRSQLRGMNDSALLSLLERDLAAASAQGLQLPVDKTVALGNLGLDSLSLVQFKGMLEGKYGCQLPDEWIFHEATTLEQVGIAVRHGSLTPEQQHVLSQPPQEGVHAAPVVGNQPQPLCPWCYCCY